MGMRYVRLCLALGLFVACLPHFQASAGFSAFDLRRGMDGLLDAPGGYGLTWMAAAGDVNGDGRRDVIVSTTTTDYNNRTDSGAAWVVFGPLKDGPTNVGDTPNGGFRIEGAEAGDYAGVGVAGLGDVNGDGLDDVLVGAYKANNVRNDQSGVAYVVFGKETNGTVDLALFKAPTPDGFRIDGASNRDHIGANIADTGDVNGDGFNDMILGSVFGGSAYVVFGKKDSTPVDLATFDLPSPQGFRIDHPTPPHNGEEAYGVEGVGDVNGDGRPDLYVDACPPTQRGYCKNKTSRAWIIFGKPGTAPVDVRDLGNAGFRIKGARDGTNLTTRPGGSADLNKDGKADFLVLGYGPYGRDAFVVYGKKNTDTIRLKKLGRRGYLINGWVGDSHGGPFNMKPFRDAAAAGDVNLDGIPDMVIGSPYSSPRGRKYAGTAFVIYGQRGRKTVELRNLGSRGYRLDGPEKNSLFPFHLEGVGKLNGDKRPDLLLNFPLRGKIIVSWGKKHGT